MLFNMCATCLCRCVVTEGGGGGVSPVWELMYTVVWGRECGRSGVSVMRGRDDPPLHGDCYREGLNPAGGALDDFYGCGVGGKHRVETLGFLSGIARVVIAGLPGGVGRIGQATPSPEVQACDFAAVDYLVKYVGVIGVTSVVAIASRG